MNGYVRGFLLDRTSSGVTAQTLEWHEGSLKHFERFLEATGTPPEPESWTATTLREFVVWLQAKPNRTTGGPLSATSVRTYCNSVWAFCRWLFMEEILPTDIAARARKPRIPQVQKPPFTAPEQKALLEAAKRTLNSHRDHAIISSLLDTGLRASELCNMEIGDVLDNNGEGHLLKVREGKGQKDRVVPISAKALLTITKYQNKVFTAAERANVHQTMFMNQRGGKMTPNGLLQMVNRVALDASVEDAHPHKFRHTFAINYLRNGGSALTLQRILGHTTLEMTNRYVSMLSDDLSREHAFASPLRNLR